MTTGKNELIGRVHELEALKKTLEESLQSVDRELTKIQDEVKDIEENEKRICDLYNGNAFINTKRTRKIAQFFKDKGYVITSLQEASPETKQRYNLAKNILSAQDALLPILRIIYKGEEDRFPISNLPATDKATVCNFFTQLSRLGWIDFSKTKTEIIFTRKIPKNALSFFNGMWAEDAIRYLIEKTLHELGITFVNTFREIKIQSVNPTKGDNIHEFDFIVEFKDRFFIFESKTGALGPARWIDHARKFDEGPNRFFMCSKDSALNPKLFQPYILFHIDAMQEEFGTFLKKEFALGENS